MPSDLKEHLPFLSRVVQNQIPLPKPVSNTVGETSDSDPFQREPPLCRCQNVFCRCILFDRGSFGCRQKLIRLVCVTLLGLTSATSLARAKQLIALLPHGAESRDAMRAASPLREPPSNRPLSKNRGPRCHGVPMTPEIPIESVPNFSGQQRHLFIPRMPPSIRGSASPSNLAAQQIQMFGFMASKGATSFLRPTSDPDLGPVGTQKFPLVQILCHSGYEFSLGALRRTLFWGECMSTNHLRGGVPLKYRTKNLGPRASRPTSQTRNAPRKPIETSIDFMSPSQPGIDGVYPPKKKRGERACLCSGAHRINCG